MACEERKHLYFCRKQSLSQIFPEEGWLKSFQLPILLKQFPAEQQLNARRMLSLSVFGVSQGFGPNGLLGAHFAWPLQSAFDRHYLPKSKAYRLIRKVCQQSRADCWPATVCKKSVELLVGNSSAQGKSARK